MAGAQFAARAACTAARQQPPQSRRRRPFGDPFRLAGVGRVRHCSRASETKTRVSAVAPALLSHVVDAPGAATGSACIWEQTGVQTGPKREQSSIIKVFRILVEPVGSMLRARAAVFTSASACPASRRQPPQPCRHELASSICLNFDCMLVIPLRAILNGLSIISAQSAAIKFMHLSGLGLVRTRALSLHSDPAKFTPACAGSCTDSNLVD